MTYYAEQLSTSTAIVARYRQPLNIYDMPLRAHYKQCRLAMPWHAGRLQAFPQSQTSDCGHVTPSLMVVFIDTIYVLFVCI